MILIPTSRLAPVLTPLAAGIACLAIPDAAAGPRQANPGRTAPAQTPESLQPFLGKPLFLPIAQLWRGNGGTSIVTTANGTVVAFQSMAGNTVRRSTDGGRMPKRTGASITKQRERMTVWASFDGGRTWPAKRLVFDGPASYSNLAAGRPGTPSAGRIFLLFEGGNDGKRAGIQVAVFNLAWILNGRPLGEFLKPTTSDAPTVPRPKSKRS